MEMENVVMELIVNGGYARSKSIEALRAARNQDFELANNKIDEANEYLEKAHNFQTNLIQSEAEGQKTEVNILMVHAQDHLMNAMTVRDLAKEMIGMYEAITK